MFKDAFGTMIHGFSSDVDTMIILSEILVAQVEAGGFGDRRRHGEEPGVERRHADGLPHQFAAATRMNGGFVCANNVRRLWRKIRFLPDNLGGGVGVGTTGETPPETSVQAAQFPGEDSEHFGAGK